MDPQQREKALSDMQKAADVFYRSAVMIGNHPFVSAA